MKKIYNKSELIFSLIFIFLYCILMSVADSLKAEKDSKGVVALAVITVLCLVLTVFIKKEGLDVKYGLCLPRVSPSKMLFYLPLAALLIVNIWHGFFCNRPLAETLIYILTMLGVGYFEELIFRGFLFNAMAKDNLTAAITVSSITFGFGHIINLFNASGMELTENVFQIASAIAVGFMFVMIYIKSKSLIFCIITHGSFNALSIFSDEAAITLKQRIFSTVFIILLCTGYALYLSFIDKKSQQKSEDNNQ